MASAVFGKLNLKDQKTIVVLDAPQSFEPELLGLRGVEIRRAPGRAPIDFALAFVTRQAKLDAYAKALTRLAQGDALLWFAYPKGTSKRYTCEFNRDTGWAALGKAGFEIVRAVAIDEDWSALRFRRADYIKTMKRAAKGALSATGRAKVASRKK